MQENHYKRKNCRQCESDDLSLAIKLKKSPLANDYSSSKESISKIKYPLDVYFCNNCKHLQLLDVVNPKKLFENYVYVSGTSPVFVEHFKNYAKYLVDKFSGNGLAIDIGSNDGTLLRFFKNLGFSVIGIEPAKKIAEQSKKNGIKTIVKFFDPLLAETIEKKEGKAKFITANNVFAHIDNPISFLEGVRILLSPDDGVFSFEVSYLREVIKNNYFDTIYHEHLDYHTLLPLKKLMRRCGFEIIDAIPINTHGGSLRVISQLKGGKYTISSSVERLIKEEKILGLEALVTYQKFSENIYDVGEKLKKVLKEIKLQGKSIIGYGAPAKATTLMHHFEIGEDIVDFIVDDSEWKHYLYTPGKGIPIVPQNFIRDKNPDYILILAWNFSKSIIEKNSEFKSKGGKFIIPLPEVKIV